MVMEGPSIKDQIRPSSTQAALSIAQILKYNSVKHMRKQADTSSFVRHRSAQETPLPTYIGLLAACTNTQEKFFLHGRYLRAGLYPMQCIYTKLSNIII